MLLLTDEEASQLANAVNEFRVPRSLIILEAIQAGLPGCDEGRIPGGRGRVVYFRLPAEVKERVKKAAQQRGVSQQSLIRHLLSTYLTNLERMTQPTQDIAEPKPPPEEQKIET